MPHNQVGRRQQRCHKTLGSTFTQWRNPIGPGNPQRKSPCNARTAGHKGITGENARNPKDASYVKNRATWRLPAPPKIPTPPLLLSSHRYISHHTSTCSSWRKEHPKHSPWFCLSSTHPKQSRILHPHPHCNPSPLLFLGNCADIVV